MTDGPFKIGKSARRTAPGSPQRWTGQECIGRLPHRPWQNCMNAKGILICFRPGHISGHSCRLHRTWQLLDPDLRKRLQGGVLQVGPFENSVADAATGDNVHDGLEARPYPNEQDEQVASQKYFHFLCAYWPIDLTGGNKMRHRLILQRQPVYLTVITLNFDHCLPG